MAKQSNRYEKKLYNILNVACAIPEDRLAIEYRFHPERRWRFDIAVPEYRVAFEVEGGSWMGGKHVNPIGFAKDCEKYNTALAMGWKVFRLVPQMITEENIIDLLVLMSESPSSPPLKPQQP